MHGERTTRASDADEQLVRIGLDLHDGPLQDIAFLVGHVRALRDDMSAGRSREDVLASIEELESVLTELERGLRTLAVTLASGRQAELEFGTELQAAVERLERRSDLRVEVSVDGSFEGLSAACRDALAHVVSEALENVRRHSGASQVSVEARASAEGARLEVRDDGAGFDPARRAGGLGLPGMAERVRRCGGTLEIESVAGGGTRVRVVVPPSAPARG